jgi:hypothetical protein
VTEAEAKAWFAISPTTAENVTQLPIAGGIEQAV